MATCIVTGTIKDMTGTAIEGATVRAYVTAPFVTDDGVFVSTGQVSAQTDSAGLWTLTLQETATASRTMTFEIEHSDGGSSVRKHTYTATVPNQASANFSDLVTLP
jgi:hypothetical protein